MPGLVMAEQTNGLVSKMADHTSQPLDEFYKQLPPEIRHITEGYQSLGKLVQRSTQECYTELENALATTASSFSSQQVNGVAKKDPASLTSDASAKARLKWLEFANANRERFIKSHILLKWGRQVDAVGRTIDVYDWMLGQKVSYEQAEEFLGNLKGDFEAAKVPQPDLHLALKVLSEGDAYRTPLVDREYLPTKPLSPKQLLRTLRNINVLLHLRLTLHETIPEQFRDYTIASGRVTFIVHEEFEVDLSIADDDPKSLFWFIDFRPLLSLRSEIPTGSLFDKLAETVNEVLEHERLAGCYKFFHEFVLTLKLNILRRQALALSRTSCWYGQLAVEFLHRSLILQYWPGRSKNWIEIGITSGLSLRARWFREKREVERWDLDFNADVEQILEKIVFKHSREILDRVQPIGNIGFRIDTSTNIIRAEFCGKSVQIDPITGKWALSPKSPRTGEYECLLNDNKTDPVRHIQAWLITEAARTIQELASARGYSVEGSGTRSLILKPWKGSSWGLSCLIHSVRDISWKIDYSKKFSLPIDLDFDEHADDSPDRTMQNLEEAALKSIIKELVARETSAAPNHGIHVLSDNPLQLSLQVERSTEFEFVDKTVRVKVAAFPSSIECKEDGSNYTVRLLVSGRINIRPGDGTDFTQLGSEEATFDSEGNFIILVDAPLEYGNFLVDLRNRLRTIARFHAILKEIKHLHFRPLSATLQRVEFAYAGESPNELAARLSFPPSSDPVLALRPGNTNPQRRLLRSFTQMLESPEAIVGESHRAFVRLLRATLPVMRAFAKFRAPPPFIHIHSAVLYVVEYQNPKFRLEVSYSNFQMWTLTLDNAPKDLPQKLRDKVWCSHATVDDIEKLLLDVDELVHSCIASKPSEAEANPVQNGTSQTQLSVTTNSNNHNHNHNTVGGRNSLKRPREDEVITLDDD